MSELEQIAKTCYQYAKLIDDKDIKVMWFNLDDRQRWFDCAKEVLAIANS
jgi:hypothetical protein